MAQINPFLRCQSSRNKRRQREPREQFAFARMDGNCCFAAFAELPVRWSRQWRSGGALWSGHLLGELLQSSGVSFSVNLS
jgi:hypothetical protein